MVRGQWRDPSTTTDTLGAYALRWVVERELSDRTRELYFGLLERQVLPSLGNVDLGGSPRHVSGPGGRICWTPALVQARWPRPTACSVR